MNSFVRPHHCGWQLAPSSFCSGLKSPLSTISFEYDNIRGPTGTCIDENNICWWIWRETNHCDKTFKMIYFVFCKYMKSIMFNIILKIYPARLLSCIKIFCLDCWLFMKEYFYNLYRSSFFINSVCKNVSKQKSLKN